MSTTIQSSSASAQAHASAFQTATSALADTGASDKDGQSTVAGNSLAHQAMDQILMATGDLSTLLSDLSANINSAAAEFEAADQAAAQIIS
ncbi:TIGR04197 family type VII secretion effector [Streptococcus sp. H31]|uniref:TIGR04197 family type VII secretion effector n=1 Tax=Streptococcus huangxiaojuni TaxID=3237239 RepID=UPI0034A3E3BD